MGLSLCVLEVAASQTANIRDAIGGDDSTAVIFCGSGSTAAIDKLTGILNPRIPEVPGAPQARSRGSWR